MNPTSQKCPECGKSNVYANRAINSAASYLLPHLGGFLHFAKFEVLVCGDCGLTRFYTDPKARAKLPTARSWSRL